MAIEVQKPASDSLSTLSIPERSQKIFTSELKEIRAQLKEEGVSKIITRAWTMDDGSQRLLAELPHNHLACNPKIKCDNIISVRLDPGSYSEKLTGCKSCEELVTVNIAMICMELGLHSLRESLTVPTPKSHKDILDQEINKYKTFKQSQK